ncbi:23S rRNA (pseudouridine(1915)-N(3))-methyltransferase RlmH [Croceimicrobium hydrocarbonivorans]|uniref:Ribosomal RNA large subunit methyltransferase H n=1 Tax=Croceimicrobium hydrocarbonivorans TaxID=2761580 RepID=A0A7H0VD32_9FLAO|nr:23S rRNA (pseudouridine(1915)-N(3))-methyltransferase RlmH [Croceimicrobium hydrocarbonivorans]QNR23630.1 23S rRNA (pseudouridine(1915)-N(3))-methyltransferase RlmH [Croceimicrobium hydrocarbonivorans]
MKVLLLLHGKTTQSATAELEQEYYQRLQRYWPFESKVLPDLRNSNKLSTQEVSQQEGQKLLAELQAGDWLVLLDEKGKSLSSRKFANQIQQWFNQSPRRLIFVIGGPYGFSPDVYARANYKLSLSAMTFSHQIVRALFAEQLYRAATILKGEPYHHD